jgi:hypothetical protein
MLEEILPAAKPLQRSQMLSAEPTIIETLPAIDSKISFLPFINYLKAKRPTVSETRERLYSYLIKKFEDEPALLHHVEDMDLVAEHSSLMELLATSLFPTVEDQEKNSFALAAPYQFRVFYYSDNFRKLFTDDDKQNLLLPSGLPAEELKKIECAMIYDHVLEKFYGMKLNESPELVYPVNDPLTGMLRYYRIRYDRRFIDIHVKGKLPPIQDCGVCMNTFRILDLEKQLATMPLDLFEVEGFAVWMAEDITISESLEAIKKILLQQEHDISIINDLRKAVKALVGLNNVEIGLMPFVRINNQFVLDEECSRYSLIARQWLGPEPENLAYFRMFTGFMNEHAEATPISNLSEEMLSFAPFMRPQYEKGARSFIMYPMQNADGLIGLLEISSPVQNALTHKVMGRLEPAIPLLSVAMLKCRDNFHDKIEKVIKEKFTALQQPVEWKFAEVAWEHLRSSDDSCDLAKNVVFENVFPLYGAIDIRNSTLERSQAIQKDLKEHLLLIDEILDRVLLLVQLPLLEGLKFKNESIREAIQANMTAEDEIRINEFISQEVEPVFDHLQKNDKHANEVIEQYFNMVKNCTSGLYRYRGEYEESVSQINDAVLSYLEKEEETIQKSYPHYFEKYRTDGIEYNIYIGQSISPQNPFNLLYLKNIRLWQLKSMAEAARITHQLLPSLKVPLQTTQLILIHSQDIAISFRRDERKFDVEGSYNIRYEIIKKRLDKVRIKDSGERLTQPGKIAMVYSNQKEVPEYHEYIEFLKNKNILKPGIEFLELEELQGVKGMKAMRVEINL